MRTATSNRPLGSTPYEPAHDARGARPPAENVAPDTTHEEVVRCMSRFGTVTYVRCPGRAPPWFRNRDSDRILGQAFP